MSQYLCIGMKHTLNYWEGYSVTAYFEDVIEFDSDPTQILMLEEVNRSHLVFSNGELSVPHLG